MVNPKNPGRFDRKGPPRGNDRRPSSSGPRGTAPRREGPRSGRPGGDRGRSSGPRAGAARGDLDEPRKPLPIVPRLAEDAADDDAGLDAPFDVTVEGETGDTNLVRLNKYLADHGVASRRKCDELITTGQVTVDGAPVTELGTKIDPAKQVVEIDGVFLRQENARKRYYVLNKPSGVVCTNEPRETRPRAVDLITDPNKGRIYTIGRLDEESKGLILLTNDGEFANKIMHPRYGIEKTYVVRVAGKIDDDSVQKIRDGVHLSEGRTSGARILVDRRTVDSSQLTLTIHEGMNREIRRVFARVGYKVTDLRRVRIGPLTDRGLKPGRWRELLFREVEALARGDTSEVQGAPRVDRARKGPPKRFAKKQGYARDLIRGGKLLPGARREKEPAVRFAPKGKKPDGARRGPARGGVGRPGARSTGSPAGRGPKARPPVGRRQRNEGGGRR